VASHASSFMTKSQCVSVLGIEVMMLPSLLASLLDDNGLDDCFGVESWIVMEDRRDCTSVCRVRRDA